MGNAISELLDEVENALINFIHLINSILSN